MRRRFRDVAGGDGDVSVRFLRQEVEKLQKQLSTTKQDVCKIF